MGSSVTINVPSSRNYQTVEKNEGGELNVETYLSGLNRQCQGIGHEVSRLSRFEVENTDKLMSLKSRIEEFDQREIQLTREIEQLERKVVMSMLQQGFKDDEPEKFGEVEEIEGCEGSREKRLESEILDLMLELGKIKDRFEGFGIGIEENKKCDKIEAFEEVGTDLDGQPLYLRQLVSEKDETKEKFEKIGNMVDNVEWGDGDVQNEIKNVNGSDNGDEEEIGETGSRELCKEIELLEVMLERGSFALLDLKKTMEEFEALEGLEKMSEMEVKMEELESGLWELKRGIVDLKGKKSEELKGRVMKVDGKLNWGSIIASLGVAVVAVTAMVFMGHTTGATYATERGNKDKNND